MRTVTKGSNADLIANVSALYLHDGAKIADVTYGKGVFWRQCRQRACTVYASDLKRPEVPTGQLSFEDNMHFYGIQADFRHLPYANGCMDVVVLDPPYIHHPGEHMTDDRYNNAATTGGMYHINILAELYLPGMLEAARVLKPRGQLWVKCKDEIESSKQKWAHREMYTLATALEYFTAKDYAVLHASSPNVASQRWERQLHLRKDHSFLWIFERTNTALLVQSRGRSRKQQSKGDHAITCIRRTPHARYLKERLAREYPYIFLKLMDGEFRSVRAAAQAAGLLRPRKATS